MAINSAGKNERKLGFHVNYQIFLPDFNQTWIFPTTFYNSPHYQISRNPTNSYRTEKHRVTERRTDMTKLTGAFRDYANAPQN
jgi:hypothetical protein